MGIVRFALRWPLHLLRLVAARSCFSALRRRSKCRQIFSRRSTSRSSRSSGSTPASTTTEMEQRFYDLQPIRDQHQRQWHQGHGGQRPSTASPRCRRIYFQPDVDLRSRGFCKGIQAGTNYISRSAAACRDPGAARRAIQRFIGRAGPAKIVLSSRPQSRRGAAL